MQYATSSSRKKDTGNGAICDICPIDPRMASLRDCHYRHFKQQALGMYFYIPGVYCWATFFW